MEASPCKIFAFERTGGFQMTVKPNLTESNGTIAFDTSQAKIIRTTVNNISLEEQELILRDGRSEDYISISCSNTLWITNLKKNPIFKCEKILVNETGRILELTGEIPKGRITLRRV